MRSRCLFGLRALLVVVMLGVGAAPASADWLFTPYLGLTFGGSANFGDVGDFEDNFEKKAVFGGSLAWMGAGIVGVEFDLGVAPNFFEITTGDDDFDFGESPFADDHLQRFGFDRLRNQSGWRCHGVLHGQRRHSRRPAVFPLAAGQRAGR